jgi:hypothetical protein
MGILIGMDEAGYGPNFGPLVVAATAWQVPDEGSRLSIQSSDDGEPASAGGQAGSATATAVRSVKRQSRDDCVDLYCLLRNIVAKSASERRVAIADSKVLYHPGMGLRQLERGVHAVLLTMRQPLTRWSAIVKSCEADPDGHHQRVCWPDGFDCPLPVDAVADELSRLAVRFTRACDACSIRPLAIRARLVFPGEFNDLVAYYGTKGAALSHVTVGLLRELMDAVFMPVEAAALPPSAFRPPPSVYAVCDKHGGRNYYTALLQHHFSESWIQPVFESHEESRYEWGEPESQVRVTFRMNGETFLPTALASMTAKYLRELAMRAFNEFWSAQVPDLRPTAGYPMDSHRFRKAIRAAQRKLGIDDHVLWRKR